MFHLLKKYSFLYATKQLWLNQWVLWDRYNIAHSTDIMLEIKPVKLREKKSTRKETKMVSPIKLWLMVVGGGDTNQWNTSRWSSTEKMAYAIFSICSVLLSQVRKKTSSPWLEIYSLKWMTFLSSLAKVIPVAALPSPGFHKNWDGSLYIIQSTGI